jgi:ATP/maltotriose-dependent transcriptional regulator MalT
MSVLLDLARERAVPVGPDSRRPGATAEVTAPTGAVSPTPTSAREARADAAMLTTKELQVLTRLSQGETNAEIAAALFVSPATVKTHLTHIYVKLGVGSRHGAMSRAVALGLLH